MNITVDGVTLASIVDRVVEHDDEGEAIGETGRTLGELVANQIVDRAISHAHWSRYFEKVSEIRTELIREAIRPHVAEAIARPIRKTNPYGEPTGEETTLTEVIVDEARKVLNMPADRSGYGSRQTYIEKTVADEVKKALAAEIADAVKQARQQVAAEIGNHVAAAVQAGLTARR